MIIDVFKIRCFGLRKDLIVSMATQQFYVTLEYYFITSLLKIWSLEINIVLKDFSRGHVSVTKSLTEETQNLVNFNICIK